MKTCALLLFALAAAGTAAVVITVVARSASHADALAQIPELLEDCRHRIEEIDRELHRLHPRPEPGDAVS